MEWLESLVLGVVQGLTEFLPISSDGHLSITQKLFAWLRGYGRSGAENLFFDVMLHLGTLAAIVIYYRRRGQDGRPGLLGSTEVPPAYRRAAVIRVGLLAVVATLPLDPAQAVPQGPDRPDVRERGGRRDRVPDHGGGPAR